MFIGINLISRNLCNVLGLVPIIVLSLVSIVLGFGTLWWVEYNTAYLGPKKHNSNGPKVSILRRF